MKHKTSLSADVYGCMGSEAESSDRLKIGRFEINLCSGLLLLTLSLSLTNSVNSRPYQKSDV
jgi:hypothetical protein